MSAMTSIEWKPLGRITILYLIRHLQSFTPRVISGAFQTGYILDWSLQSALQSNFSTPPTLCALSLPISGEEYNYESQRYEFVGKLLREILFYTKIAFTSFLGNIFSYIGFLRCVIDNLHVEITCY